MMNLINAFAELKDGMGVNGALKNNALGLNALCYITQKLYVINMSLFPVD